MRRTGLAAIMIIILAGPCHQVLADRSLRCGTRLVSIGDYTWEVLQACGEPDWRDTWEEHRHSDIYRIFDYETERYRLPERIHGPLRMERWTYDLGSNRFVRFLEFENEKLIRIRTGDKGSG